MFDRQSSNPPENFSKMGIGFSKESDLVCTKIAARIINMSVAFLERDRWQGPSIPFHKIGNRAVRYSRAVLAQWLKDREIRNDHGPEGH
jgi:hypothetical protein